MRHGSVKQAFARAITLCAVMTNTTPPMWGQGQTANTATTHDRQLLGFSRDHTVQERELETRFDTLLDRDLMRAALNRLAAHPHHIGSLYNNKNAEYIAAQFRALGYQTEIEQFKVLFPTPKHRFLELETPHPFRARLAEQRSPGDNGRLPTYCAYSCDGDVSGRLVYANYGLPGDYATLEANGVDIKGKIVIARYGHGYRGVKVRVAAEHGAVGCLLYSDPRDDGYYQGEVYPEGPYRPDDCVQMGSVMDMPLRPGNPFVLGSNASPEAIRRAVKAADTITKIPVLPLCYADALPLLRALGGPVAPETWRGALPTLYHLGPSQANVHLKLSFDWNWVYARDVIAKLAGSEHPDEWIIRGNHFDGWVFGAWDPVSSLVSEMNEARAIGQLAECGWRPKRTLVYAAWDGEEPGLLGSTEWCEAHKELLSHNAVVYINSDENGRGFLEASGSHTLEAFMSGVTDDVIDPQTGVSVATRSLARQVVQGDKQARQQQGIHLRPPGSGSDFAAFVHHLGIAVIEVGYSGEDGGDGTYHSGKDDVYRYVRFCDPGFDYAVTLAQTTGRMMLRLGNADLLPFEFTHLADMLERSVKEVADLTDTMRADTEELNHQIAENSVIIAADHRKVIIPPKPHDPVASINFKPLQNALAKVRESARGYATALNTPGLSDYVLPPERLLAIDQLLMSEEHTMLRAEGLPRRPWYRHYFYAPGFYTGYGAKTLPAVREAIEQRQWQEADREIALTADTMEKLADRIDLAAAAVHQISH